MALSKYIVGWMLVVSAPASVALSIGPVRGEVWIEQALDVVVPIQLDAPGDDKPLCPAAELSYGDASVDARLVRVVAEGSADSAVLRLRISSSAPVNDAFVSLVVQVGCTQRVVRRFQLLPDFPATAAITSPPVLAQVPEPAVSSAAPPPAVTAAKPVRSAARVGNAEKKVRVPRKTPAGAKTKVPVPDSTGEANPGGARLTLAPLSVLGQRAVVPQASHAPDPEMLAAQEELQRLRADYLGLQLQATRTEAEFASLREHLAQAEAERNRVILLASGGFAAMVALVAVGLVWWGRRERERLRQMEDLDDDEQELLSDLNAVAADKWQAPAAQDAAVDEDITVEMPLDAVVVEHPAPAAPPKTVRPGPAVDIDIDLPLGQQGYRL